jgi:hypothetical protein
MKIEGRNVGGRGSASAEVVFFAVLVLTVMFFMARIVTSLSW